MTILVFNPGSSSLKFGCYELLADEEQASRETCVFSGDVERIGTGRAQLSWNNAPSTEPIAADTAAIAAKEVVHRLRANADFLATLHPLDAIGCRVVHGGVFTGPKLITDRVQREIRELDQLAPLHNASDANVIATVCAAFPDKPIVAVFDTLFHRTLPPVASTYAIPAQLATAYRLRRYGFHGIAHKYVSGRLEQRMAPKSEERRFITCHLGNGASVCAVRNGQSIDTSMGLTPLEGLVMGTRCGDLDPGLVLFLAKSTGMSLAEVESLLNHQSGLLGISDGWSSDIRDLASASADGNPHAALALEIFSYRVAKYIGAYAVALEGLDAIAFSGGIGEHSAEIRQCILRPLGFLGLTLDEERNATALGELEAPLHAEGSRIEAWLIPADENLQIAREVRNCCAG